MRRATYLLSFFFLATPLLTAQTSWYQLVSAAELPAGERRVLPDRSVNWSADQQQLLQLLDAAPHEEDGIAGPAVTISLPDPDGNALSFTLVRYAIMEAPLAVAYPDIRTLYGVATDGSARSLRISWSARGLHASVRGGGKDFFVDPYLWAGGSVYQSYYKEFYPVPQNGFECSFDDKEAEHLKDPLTDEEKSAGDCRLRSYRMAIATTAEYCAFHGATSPAQAGLVMDALVVSFTRLNQVFEADLAIRILIAADQEDLFAYDTNTDGLTNNNAGALINESPGVINAAIGLDGYDIGHVYGTGGNNGVAQLNSPCTSNKGRGVTLRSNPTGDPFNIDYVAHEMGHQFGAGHTQNNGCNYSSSSGMEPGSAATIMGYAGICSPNVQNNSDAYFHGISVQQISNYMESGFGSSCSTTAGGTNNAPQVTSQQNYVIPRGTPFVLTATASDPNNHPLTYCWEQYDPEQGASMPPAGTNVQGPLFRSFFPSPEPSRYFPRLIDLVDNVDPTWEELPTVARTLDFRVTVRDFTGTYGCTDEDNVLLTVAGNSGPFVVQNPSATGVQWFQNTTEQVLWNVASTNLAPVSTPRVDILLSTDGGFTYPITLATNVNNSGSALVSVPNLLTNQARVMVRGRGNVFFDISNNNFSIVPEPDEDFDFFIQPDDLTVCTNDPSANVIIDVQSIGGFAGPVSLSIVAAPGGLTSNFSPATVLAGQQSTLTLGGFSSLGSGSYTLTVRANASLGIREKFFVLNIVDPADTPTQLSPQNGALDQPVTVVLDWTDENDAIEYEVEVADNPGLNGSFSQDGFIASQATATDLEDQTTYYWRVRATSLCGTGSWSGLFSFTTAVCQVYSYDGQAVNISENGTPTVTADIAVVDQGSIVDLDVIDLDVQHSYLGDLEISLQKVGSNNRRLYDRRCGTTNNMLASFDDEAGTPESGFDCNNSTGGQIVQPNQTLSVFDGQSINGTWRLTVRDRADQDGGQLRGFNVRMCVAQFLALPVTWLDFTALPASPTTVRLDWLVADEEDNEGFEVQRRAVHEREFQPVAWLDGRNQRGEQAYAHLDENLAPGTYDYRIRQLDRDGKESFSILRSVTLGSAGAVVRLFPNPAPAGEVTVELTGAELANGAGYRLIDVLGRTVRTGELPGGRSDFTTAELVSGLYFLHIGNSKTMLRLLVK